MNPISQRIEIAKHYGFVRLGAMEGSDELMGDFPPGRGWVRVPDFRNDQNAMWEVLKSLTIENYAAYENNLCRVVDATGKDSDIWFHVLNASAQQKAEAFLRTIGKWQEEAVTP